MITALDPKTALVLIDLQNNIAAYPFLHPSAEIIERSGKLADAFRAKNLPVVLINVNTLGAKWTFVRSEKSSSPKTAEAIAEAKAQAEASGAINIVPQLKIHDTDLQITKHTWSAFFETPLHHELQKRGITGIVLAGIATSIGVEGTARTASELGYNLTFASDAMTDFALPQHEHSLTTIFPRIGEIDTTDAIIVHLQPLA
nr:isochorismatase family protein [Mucilaginibacter sp. L294]